jgi:hypothetical protein
MSRSHGGRLEPPLLARVKQECNVCTARADVAQLVEQRFRKPQVTGSNPVVGSSPERFRGCHAVASAETEPFDLKQFFAASYGLADTQLRTVEIR